MAASLLNPWDPLFLQSVACIVAAPVIWNAVARYEYRRHTLRKLTGSPQGATFVMALWIFFFSLFRDYVVVERMIPSQPRFAGLDNDAARAAGALAVAVGQVLVLSSMWRLGLAGTYLGDYAGWFIFTEPVTAFPFSVCSAPMYYGSSLSFLGTALWKASPAGLVASAVVFVVYEVATRVFEDPFTAMIYRKRAEELAKAE